MAAEVLLTTRSLLVSVAVEVTLVVMVVSIMLLEVRVQLTVVAVVVVVVPVALLEAMEVAVVLPCCSLTSIRIQHLV
jgi:hypothetical protein